MAIRSAARRLSTLPRKRPQSSFASMSPPPAYEPLGGICVHPHLRQFIDERVLPGTGISADRFWSSLGGIVRELGPKNAELLQKRDTLQASIDEWLRANSSADGAQHASFLKAIGYLAPEFRSSVVTQGIDDEIAHVAGPQLVCPVDNSRFILNAANARWGSLLDAFYGTNAVSSLPGSGQGTYDAARGRAVFDAAHSVLDELFPLSAGVWGDVTALSVENGTLKAAMGSQREATLLAKEQFAGFAAGADDYSSQLSLLLKHNGLHVEILLDRSGKAKEHPAGIRDIRIESALSTICDFEDSACTVDAEVRDQYQFPHRGDAAVPMHLLAPLRTRPARLQRPISPQRTMGATPHRAARPSPHPAAKQPLPTTRPPTSRRTRCLRTATGWG